MFFFKLVQQWNLPFFQRPRSQSKRWKVIVGQKVDDTKYILLGTTIKKPSWGSQLLTPSVTKRPIKTTAHERWPQSLEEYLTHSLTLLCRNILHSLRFFTGTINQPSANVCHSGDRAPLPLVMTQKRAGPESQYTRPHHQRGWLLKRSWAACSPLVKSK